MFIEGKLIRLVVEVNGKFSGRDRGGVDLFKSPLGAAARAVGCCRKMSAAGFGKKICCVKDRLGKGA
jgi:hypothetical protein